MYTWDHVQFNDKQFNSKSNSKTEIKSQFKVIPKGSLLKTAWISSVYSNLTQLIVVVELLYTLGKFRQKQLPPKCK